MSTEEYAELGTSRFDIVLRLVLLLAIVSAAAIAITWFDVLKLPGEFDGRYLILAIIVQVVSWFLSTYSWQCVVMVSTGKKLPFVECFAQNSLLLVGKYIPGKIWGIVARIHQLKKFDIDTNPAIHASYLEQLSSLHVGLVFGMSAWLIALEHGWRWWVTGLGLASLLLLPLCHALVINTLFEVTPAKWREKLKVYSVIKIRSFEYLFISLLYLFEWILTGAIAICIFMIMSGALPSFQFALLLAGSNAVSMVTGFVAIFAPAGIGVREIVNAEMLLTMLTLAETAGLVVLLRCWSVVTDISLGGLVLLQRSSSLLNASNSKDTPR